MTIPAADAEGDIGLPSQNSTNFEATAVGSPFFQSPTFPWR